MIRSSQPVRAKTLWICVAALLATTPTVAPAAEPADKYMYDVKIDLFSIGTGDATQVAENYQYLGSGRYQQHGSGSTGGWGTVGLEATLADQNFNITVVKKRAAGCHLDVKVAPGKKNNPPSKPQRYELDLTNLKPVSLNLASDPKDDRTLVLNLIPSIHRLEPPARLDEDTVHFTDWVCDQSRVIVDGWRYAGVININGGPLGFADLAGLAKVEFALQPFRDAQPTGILQNETLTLTQENGGIPQHIVTISNVHTGAAQSQLGSRPYLVWVRWSPSSLSLQQAMERAEKTDQRLHGVAPPDLSREGPLASACKAISSPMFGCGAISPSDRTESPPAD